MVVFLIASMALGRVWSVYAIKVGMVFIVRRKEHAEYME